MTPNTHARLSEDRLAIVCGREFEKGFGCGERLAIIVDQPRRYPMFTEDWYPRADGVLVRGAGSWERAQRGWNPARHGRYVHEDGRREHTRVSFPFPIRAKCPRPHCGLVNDFDAGELDIVEVPPSA